MIDKETFVSEITKVIYPVISMKVLTEEKFFSSGKIEFEEMKREYTSLLSLRYDVLSKNVRFINMNANEVIKRISVLDLRIIKGFSLIELKRLYLPDESLDELARMSDDAFKKAISFYEGAPVIMVEDADKEISKMKKVADSVKPYNKETAKLLLSEASVDLGYYTGESEAISFRFHDYIESLKRKEK